MGNREEDEQTSSIKRKLKLFSNKKISRDDDTILFKSFNARPSRDINELKNIYYPEHKSFYIESRQGNSLIRRFAELQHQPGRCRKKEQIRAEGLFTRKSQRTRLVDSESRNHEDRIQCGVEQATVGTPK